MRELRLSSTSVLTFSVLTWARPTGYLHFGRLDVRHDLEATMVERPEACPACGGTGLIKSGRACGRQRWRCKGCGRQFTRTTPHGKPAAVKREAVGLYCTGLSLNAVGKRLGVSAQSRRSMSDRFPATRP